MVVPPVPVEMLTVAVFAAGMVTAKLAPLGVALTENDEAPAIYSIRDHPPLTG